MDPDRDRLEAELAEARRRIDELSREIEAHRQLEDELRESEERFRALAEASNETIIFLDGGVIRDVNARVKSMFGYETAEVIGKPSSDFVAPEHRANVGKNVSSGYALPYEAVGVRKDGSRFPIEICGRSFPFRGRTARVAVVLDITERKHAEEATREAAAREEAIRTRDAILRQLATPILPITERVVVAPLIGEMNEERGAQAAETLVYEVARSGAKVAILDITGVPTMDTRFADQLLGAARAIRLLGVEVVLTGIGPALAQTAVQAGISLEGVVTMSTLQRGVAYAMVRNGRAAPVKKGA